MSEQVKMIDRERERARQKDRQTDTKKQRERERDRQTDRQTKRSREREREKEREGCVLHDISQFTVLSIFTPSSSNQFISFAMILSFL